MQMEPSNNDPSSNLTLTFGTKLKLVAEEDIPEQLYDRTPWNNYVVYLPGRDENGNYVRNIGFIPQSADVHVGYYSLTQRNLLELAFGCLGVRYGWGGMADCMDCSLYVRTVYECCGLILPRNSTWQCAIPTDNADIREYSTDEKRAFLASFETGGVLCFADSGHVVLYLGSVNGYQYVIGDTGFLYESNLGFESEDFRSVQGVVVNSLDVKRPNGLTWIESTGFAIRPWQAK